MTKFKTDLMRRKGYIHKEYCGRFGVAFISLIRSGIGLLIGLCSTVLVLPMFKVGAKVFNCEYPMDGSKPFLHQKPDIYCYEGDHLKLAGALILLESIYLTVLLPYVVVNGDSEFMKRAHLLSPADWTAQAIRKATLMYQGPLHPDCDSIFATRVSQLLTRIALPVIVLLTSSCPLVQTLLIASCGLSTFVVTSVRQPVVDTTTCAVLRGMDLFAFLCMCSGLVTVVLPHGKRWSDYLVLAPFVFSVALAYFQIRKVKKSELETDELRSLGSWENEGGYNHGSLVGTGQVE